MASVLGVIGSPRRENGLSYPLDPLPVARLNLDRVLAQAKSLGQRLAEQAALGVSAR